MYKTNCLMLCLQMFADGGEGATGVTGTAAVSQTGDKGSLAAVQYGKQAQQSAPAAEVQEETESKPVDKNAEFERLIRGEFKELYKSKVQDTVQKRLKSTQETVDKYNALMPTLELLGKRYGVDAADAKALAAAVENDDAYWEREAADRGSTVEDVKRLYKAERETAVLRRQMQQQQEQEAANRQYNTWMQDAEGLKGVYPAFDLDNEMQDGKFVRLLRNGVDMRTAYEVIHRDEIIPAAMQFAAKETEKRVASTIAAGAARPTENGNSSRSASNVRDDVSKLSNADIREVRKRVMGGEKITFG